MRFKNIVSYIKSKIPHMKVKNLKLSHQEILEVSFNYNVVIAKIIRHKYILESLLESPWFGLLYLTCH